MADLSGRARSWLLAVVAVLGLIGSVDGLLSLMDRWQGVDLAGLLSVVRLTSGPLALVFALLLWRRPERNPRPAIRPEWDSENQVGHWEGVRRMAAAAQAELRRNVAAGDVTVGDRNNLRNLVDSLDLQVSNYADLWGGATYWDQRARERWTSRHRGSYDGPVWARDLSERIGYASAWISANDPLASPWADPGSGARR